MQDSATATPSAAKVRSEGSSKSLDANPLTSTSVVKSSDPATTAPPGESQKAGKGNGGEGGESQNSGNAPEEKPEEAAAAAMDVEAMLHHRKHHHHHPPPPVRPRSCNLHISYPMPPYTVTCTDYKIITFKLWLQF